LYDISRAIIDRSAVCTLAQVFGDPFAQFRGHVTCHVVRKFSPYFLAGDFYEMSSFFHGFSLRSIRHQQKGDKRCYSEPIETPLKPSWPCRIRRARERLKAANGPGYRQRIVIDSSLPAARESINRGQIRYE
jgi:hypothetical protein